MKKKEAARRRLVRGVIQLILFLAAPSSVYDSLFRNQIPVYSDWERGTFGDGLLFKGTGAPKSVYRSVWTILLRLCLRLRQPGGSDVYPGQMAAKENEEEVSCDTGEMGHEADVGKIYLAGRHFYSVSVGNLRTVVRNQPLGCIFHAHCPSAAWRGICGRGSASDLNISGDAFGGAVFL